MVPLHPAANLMLLKNFHVGYESKRLGHSVTEHLLGMWKILEYLTETLKNQFDNGLRKEKPVPCPSLQASSIQCYTAPEQ